MTSKRKLTIAEPLNNKIRSFRGMSKIEFEPIPGKQTVNAEVRTMQSLTYPSPPLYLLHNITKHMLNIIICR